MTSKTLKAPTTHNDEKRDWEHLMLPGAMDVADIVKLAPAGLPAPLPPIVIRPDTFCLKKLKIHLDMSEETTAFSAEVWFRKKLVGYAKNDGHGGSTFVRQSEKGAMHTAEEWASTLPPESAYQRVYDSMEQAESEFTEMSMEKMNAEYWAATSKVDLESLIDGIVEAAAARKSVRNMSSLIICGPHRDRMDEPPCIRQFKKTPTAGQLEHSRSLYKWVCLASDVFDIPYHYYPSPHPFYGCGWPKQKVTVGGREAEVVWDGTNDCRVAVRFDHKPEETMYYTPEEVELL
jgi:hypothetical protein